MFLYVQTLPIRDLRDGLSEAKVVDRAPTYVKTKEKVLET
jgi:hypothetical protein